MGKKSSAMARLVTSIEIKHDDGTVTNVPVSKEDNSVANKVLITQVRTMISGAIKEYKDKGITLSPKDLRELASAVREVADSSTEIYKDGEDVVPPSTEKKVEALPDEISFDAIKPDDNSSSKANPPPSS